MNYIKTFLIGLLTLITVPVWPIIFLITAIHTLGERSIRAWIETWEDK